MKRLAKIFLAFLGIFTLTSCMDLLPMPSRRTRSSSLSSEVMNEDYSTNERSSNSRTSRSSYTGEKNYYIETSDPAPNGFVNQTVSVYFYLTDDNGQHAELADNCFVESFSPDLTVAWAREYDYLEVLLNATNSGYYQFRVTVKATSGPSRTNNYYYNAVEGVDDISNYYVEHGDNIDAYYMSDTFLHFRILNKYNGNARRFDINHPYDVISLPSSAQIEYFDFVDNETTLRIVIKGFDYTPAEGHQFYLVLFDEAGNSFDTWLTYIIKPAAYLSIDGIDETPLIEHGETVIYTFKLYSGEDNSRLYISKEGYELVSGDYLMELDYIDSSKIRVRITNNKNVDEGWFCVRVISENGFKYEASYVAVTNDRYMNYYWMQFNGEYFAYNKSSYFIVTLFNRHGDNKLIRDMTVTSTNGIIPNATIKDINDYSYTYRFVPTRRGVEVFTIELVCADGSIYTSGFEVNIQ